MYCRNCGKELNENAAVCLNSALRQEQGSRFVTIVGKRRMKMKKKVVSMIICLIITLSIFTTGCNKKVDYSSPDQFFEYYQAYCDELVVLYDLIDDFSKPLNEAMFTDEAMVNFEKEFDKIYNSKEVKKTEKKIEKQIEKLNKLNDPAWLDNFFDYQEELSWIETSLTMYFWAERNYSNHTTWDEYTDSVFNCASIAWDAYSSVFGS